MKLQDCKAGMVVSHTQLGISGILTGATKLVDAYMDSSIHYVVVAVVLQHGIKYWVTPTNLMPYKKPLNTTSAEEIT